MRGNIEVITGPMFSGKTTELLRRLTQASHQGHRVMCFAPALDTRPPGPLLQTHDGSTYPATVLRDAFLIPELSADVQVVGIDEGQFWGPSLVRVADQLADAGHRVIVAGLDQTSAREPFGVMPQLLAIAEHVQKRRARCDVCGADATVTLRLATSAETVLVGGHESYSPRCRCCWREEVRS